MPNDCGNTVIIIGQEKDIDLFEEKGLSFSYFFPPPEDAEDNWHSDHWGTKWDCYDMTVERNGAYGIEFKFSTAWAPPIAFLTHLLRQYPRCWMKLQWCEPMMMCAGVWIGYVKNGDLKVKELDWIEPLAMLTTEGEVLTEM
jgi:hypothetical protein